MKNEKENSSVMCKIFGHKYVEVYNYKESPVDTYTLYDQLKTIKDTVSDWQMREELQSRVKITTKTKTYIKTYCKRCGDVVGD